MANKIKYGLRSVHYAKATIAADGSATYTAPVPWPGAVSLSMEPQGENTQFHADNIVYWVGAANNGYEGDLEMARVSDQFKKDILGYIEDGNGILIESADPTVQHFALLFQFEGDQKATRHVLYNCTAGRPNTSGQTKGETTEPQTETVSIVASSVWNETLQKDIAKAETIESSQETAYNAWFENVYQPVASGGGEG